MNKPIDQQIKHLEHHLRLLLASVQKTDQHDAEGAVQQHRRLESLRTLLDTIKEALAVRVPPPSLSTQLVALLRGGNGPCPACGKNHEDERREGLT